MLLGTLHYIYDPLCGWCYGAAPLVAAAESIEGLRVELHAGGMMTGTRRQRVVDLRGFVRTHNERVTALTGQEFGDAYQRLQLDEDAVYDSEPPTTAILAAGERGLEMLRALQRAQYREGRRIAERAVLEDLAQEIGLPEFTVAYDRCWGELTRAHIEDSRALLARLGGQGFPTFALQDTRMESAGFLGKPAAWRDRLVTALGQSHA
jgi:putative protein-disulfide isomerase